MRRILTPIAALALCGLAFGTTAEADDTDTVRGVITDVSDDHLTLVPKGDDDTFTVHVDEDDTRVKIDGDKADLDELEPGMYAKVLFDEDDGMAERITAKSEDYDHSHDHD